MDEKQYAIKCGVCGTEFYILAPACPNCRAKGQSRLFNYLSQNEAIEFAIHILTIIYNIPLFAMYLFLYIAIAVASLFMLLVITEIFKSIYEGVFFEFFKYLIGNCENCIVWIIAIFVMCSVFSFLEKIIDRKHLSSCIGYKRKKYRRFCLYMASEEIIRYFSCLPEELEFEIYNRYGYKIKNKILLLKNCIDTLEKARNECRLRIDKDIQITIKKMKEVGGINVSDVAEYFSEKKHKYIAKQKEILNDPDKIHLFLIDIPQKKDINVAIAADSENMFTYYKIINTISFLLLIIILLKIDSIYYWIEKNVIP